MRFRKAIARERTPGGARLFAAVRAERDVDPLGLEIPTAIPIVYELDAGLCVVSKELL